jgi:hypothetical protein
VRAAADDESGVEIDIDFPDIDSYVGYPVATTDADYGEERSDIDSQADATTTPALTTMAASFDSTWRLVFFHTVSGCVRFISPR